MNGTGSTPDTGATTGTDRAAGRTAALRALVVAALLGAAIWAAGWSWNAPFTPDTGAGMFTDHHGALRAVGCVITIPAVAAVLSYRGHPYAGAVGVSLGFGLLWSVDACITSYSNAFVGLRLGAMWVCVGAGTALAAWNAHILRRDREDPREAFDHGGTTETDALTRWRNLRRGTSHR